MAQIDTAALTGLLAESLLNGTLPDGESLRKAFDNPPRGNRFAVRGIALCYESEGIRCLMKAYGQLQEKVLPIEFAREVADAVNVFAKPFPEGRDDNLTYAHFLFHGLQLPTVKGICAKIIDNGRIMHESQAVQNELKERFGKPVPIQARGSTFYLALTSGFADDYHGLSYQLTPFPSAGSFNPHSLSKVGFLIDTTNSCAYIINVQGQQTSKNAEKRAKSGKSFRELGEKLGMDPRAFVVKRTIELCYRMGLEGVRAIKPGQHPMSIGSHNGFVGKYEPALISAGLDIDENVYWAAYRKAS